MKIDTTIKELYGKDPSAKRTENTQKRPRSAHYARLPDSSKRGSKSGRLMRISFAHTQEAINADMRAGNQSRPNNLFDVLSPLYKEMIEEADDPVLEGLLQE